MIFKARKLWENGNLAACGDITLSCEQIGAATSAWLVPGAGMCGANYNLLLSLPDPYPFNTLTGVYVPLPGGQGVVLDIADAGQINQVCNGCCGDVSLIPANYNGTFPPIQEPALLTVSFTREDTGDGVAYMKVSQQYFGQYATGTFNRIAYAAGVSTYQYGTYGTPVFVAGDTPTGTFARVFTSNSAPTLPGGDVYSLTVGVKQGALSPVLTASSLANLVTAANANADYAALGVYAVTNTTFIKLTAATDSLNYATLVIGVQPS